MSDDPAKNPYTSGSGSFGQANSPGGAMTIAGFASIGTLISIALVTGLLLISGFMSYMVLSDPPEDAPVFQFGGDNLLFLIIGYAVFFVCAATAFVIPAMMRRQAMETYKVSNAQLPQPLEPKSTLPAEAQSLLAVNQSATLVGQALMEGPAVANAVLMLVGENLAHLAPIALAVVGIAMQVPTAGKLQNLLEEARMRHR